MEKSNIKKSVQITVQVSRIKYPSGQRVSEGTWGTLACVDVKSGNSISVVGELPKIDMHTDAKTYFSLMANVVEHPTYGLQYQIVYMQPSLASENDYSTRQFLSYILSERQVEALYNTLSDPLKVIKEKDIDALCEVKGIKTVTAQRIIQKYEENKQYEMAYSKLGQYNLSVSIIDKLLKRYRNLDKISKILEENPYQLIRDIKGIGWAKADEIGMKVGIAFDSPQRIAGFICYYLEEQAQVGNSWLTPDVITAGVLKLFDSEYINSHKDTIMKSFGDAITQLTDNDILRFDEERNRVFLLKYYNLERKIANELLRLLDGNNRRIFPGFTIDSIVRQIEEERGWKLTDEQINGAKIFGESNVGVITGASGTGKSSTVEVLVRAFKGYRIAQVALAGRAASRLTEITGLEGSTIHRLLGIDVETGGFLHNKQNPLDVDIVILDEISMVGGELFYSLIQAIPTGAKLIMVGDHNQLESIGCLNILKDLLECRVIPCQVLNKIHRQALKSGIITESFHVRNGESITNGCVDGGSYVRGELEDFELRINNAHTEEAIFEAFKENYERLQDINKLQIIVPMRDRGSISVSALNTMIQNYYNPESKHSSLNTLPLKNDKCFRVGDKVINIVNSYNCLNTNGDKVDVYNGYIGIIKEINRLERTLVVDFSMNYDKVGEVIYEDKMLGSLQLAYAITCHKFQGSETDTVIVGVNYSAYTLLCRQWVYTAITRAKKKCILCAEKRALETAIATTKVSTKQTLLSEMLSGYYDLNADLKNSSSNDDEYTYSLYEE